MKNLKSLLPWIPECYFIIFSIWWTESLYTPHQIINYPAMLLAIVLVLQFFIRNRNVGIIVSSLMGLYSAYLILALWSDLAKGPVWDEVALRFHLKGGLLIATNITMAVLMFRKYYAQIESSRVMTTKQQ